MDLNDLLAREDCLPSIPKVLALLHAELGQHAPDLRKICQLFGGDPAIAASLLRCANHQGGALSGRVGGVSEALALLSLAQVRAVVGAASVGTTFATIPGVNLQQFWRYSLDTAKVARSLAGCTRQNQAMAYTAGLLHALGELLMHVGLPDAMADLNTLVPPLDTERVHAEQRALGFCYADVSAGFARKWCFPAAMVDALAQQHTPFQDDACEPLAGVLHLAAWRARARQARLGASAMAVSFPDVVGLTLGLDIDIVLRQTPTDWAPLDALSFIV